MAAHQNQDDKFEANISILAGDKFKANISILAGDCHFVATSNSCCVAAFYKHSVFVLLSHFEAGLPYEDLMKRVPRLAWALAPTTGHWEVSGQRGPVALQRGHGEDGGAPHHSRPSSGTSTDWSQGSQIPASASAKAQWLFQAGNKRGFPLFPREDLSKQDLGLPSSESKAGAVGRSSVMSSAVLTHCSRGFSPTAVLFRPASLKIVF